jgi:hypothetical protein
MLWKHFIICDYNIYLDKHDIAYRAEKDVSRKIQFCW